MSKKFLASLLRVRRGWFANHALHLPASAARLPSARLVAALAAPGPLRLPQADQRDITRELPTKFSSVLGYTPSQSIPNMQTPSEILIGHGTTMGLSPAGSCAQ